MSELHDARGKFKPGNPGGPGRPKRAVEQDYLRALSDAVPLEDWKRAVAAVARQALGGDLKAFEILAKYLVGPPERGALKELAVVDALGDDPVEQEVERILRVREDSWCDKLLNDVRQLI